MPRISWQDICKPKIIPHTIDSPLSPPHSHSFNNCLFMKSISLFCLAILFCLCSFGQDTSSRKPPPSRDTIPVKPAPAKATLRQPVIAPKDSVPHQPAAAKD